MTRSLASLNGWREVLRKAIHGICRRRCHRWRGRPRQAWGGDSRAGLKKAVTVVGIRPLEESAAAKITAHTPDGRVIPMLWLLNYRTKFMRTFTYRDPVRLPAATRLVAEPPVRFEIVVR